MAPIPPAMPVEDAYHGHAHLVIVHPPFPPALRPRERPALTPHTPRAARDAVLSLAGVCAVREEYAPEPLGHPEHPVNRAELDVVRAAAWGPVVKVTDPALVEDGGLGLALEEEFEAQKERHPHSRIVAECSRDAGSLFTKLLVAAPGTDDLMVEGFGELDFIGDPHATLAAAGLPPSALGGDFAKHPEAAFPYDAFLHAVTCGALSVYGGEKRLQSGFVVDRSEAAEDTVREVWFPSPEDDDT